MFKIAGLVAILTVLSKILGLARDLVIAHYFGTSMQADAFNIAYLLTGNFFIILGGIGGPFYSTFVAVLPKLQKDNLSFQKFLKDILFKFFSISLVFVVVFYFVKDYILKIFIDESIKPEYFQQTLINIDILLPLILITAPIGILFAALNCLKKYIAPSLAPAIVNVVLIFTVLVMGDGYNGLALAIGTSIGGILSMIVQIPFISDPKAKSLLEASEELLVKYKAEFYLLLLPALLSTISTQVMVFIDSYFCKYLQEGSWTALTLANRLVQMPLGVVLTAFLVPVFPKISEMVHDNRLARIKEVLTKSLLVLVALSIPAIILAMIFSQELIAFIFQRGAFDAESTRLVADVFFYLSLSAIPYIFRDSFTRTLYCFGDSKSPFVIMLVVLVIKFILNSFLVPSLGLSAIAISTVIASSLNAICLFFILKSKFD